MRKRNKGTVDLAKSFGSPTRTRGKECKPSAIKQHKTNIEQTFEIGTEILAAVSPKQGFADAIVREGSLWRLLRVLEQAEGASEAGEDGAKLQKLAIRQQKGWALLEALSSSPSVALQLVRSSGWLQLLGIVAGYSKYTKSWASRQGAAKALSRLLWDPQTSQITGTFLDP